METLQRTGASGPGTERASAAFHTRILRHSQICQEAATILDKQIIPGWMQRDWH